MAEYKTIGNSKFEIITKKIVSLKPVRDENIQKGKLKYIDILKYLIRIMPQEDSSYETIISLTSYLINSENKINDKQAKLITHFIKYWQEKGILDID